MKKSTLYIAGGWLLFIILFWFIGAAPKMTKFEAFFGLAGLTAVYAGIVKLVEIIRAGSKKKETI